MEIKMSQDGSNKKEVVSAIVDYLKKPKMTANELRIGNWVAMDKEYRQIRRDDFEMANYIESTFDPIRLSPEILEKAGLLGNRPIKPEYLHQLQNLYFALTGEELNIEL